MTDIIEHHFDTAGAFLSFIRGSNDDWWDSDDIKRRFFFRGHADASWDLLPSGWRPLGDHNKLTSLIRALERKLDAGEYTVQNFEGYKRRELIVWMNALNEASAEFSEMCRRVGLDVPYGARSLFDGQTISSGIGPQFPAIRPLAQHHGIPTHLLDWTENPLVAAYFAAAALPDKHMCVWAIHHNLDHSKLRADLHGVSLSVIFDHVRLPQNKFQFAQSGLFTTIAQAEYYFDRVGSWPTMEILHANLPVPILSKVTLIAEQKPRLLELLWRENISAAHLMPTYDNAAAAAVARLQAR